MKCYRLPAFLLAFICGLSPIFSQTADQTEGCVPVTVNFTPPAGSSTFFWEFGDGGTSSVGPASHSYLDVGTFTVNFRESDGGPILGTIEITVYPDITVDVTASNPMGCAPLTTDLNSVVQVADGIIITNYSWTFGNGQGVSGALESNPTYTYDNPGTFNVGITLSTNLPSCGVTDLFVNLVSASGPPNVSFLTSPTPATSCTAPLVVNFISNTPNQENLDLSWDFGNGSPGSTAIDPPPVTYTEEGSYEVVLTATDENGCSGTFSQLVVIGPPFVDFEFQNDTICSGSGVISMINNSGPGSYQWTFGGGAFPSSSTQFQPLVQFSQGGLIDVTLVVTSTDGLCSETLTQQIFVDEVDASFTSVPTYSCEVDLDAQFFPTSTNAAQYIWTFEGGGTSEDQNPTWTYTNEDTTTHGINGLNEFVTSLTVVTNSGCFATFTVTDTIHQPNALFLPDVTQGCAPLTVDFENQSTNDFQITSYLWDFGDGTTQVTNTDDNQVHTYTQAGEYEVVLSLTDELGCLDTSFVQTIFVGEPITPDFDFTPVTICAGESITLEALSTQAEIDGWHFFTDGNRSFHCFQENTLTHVFETETGTFDVTLEQEYNGCYSQVTIADLITVQGPIAQIDYLVDCDNPYDISFRDSSMEATSITWDFGDMQDSTLNDVIHTYADTGAYQVILTASNPGTGCPDSKDTVTVYVQEITAVFEFDTIACLGLPYELTSGQSQNVNADCHRGYTWSFSDTNDRPVTTQDTVIEHIFEQVGDNFIFLETRDINGCLAFDTMKTRVFGVYPSFTPDPIIICIPGTVNFSDFSTADTTITTWMWDFGDGEMSEDQEPTHTFNTFPTNPDTTFTVTLSLQDVVGCGGMIVQSVQVYEPISTITAQPSLNICVGDEIDFSASDFTEQSSSLNFNWNFGNGQLSSDQDFTATYPTAGNFTVTLNYVEQGSNCVGPEQQVNVSVQDYPIASFITSLDDPTEPQCAPAEIMFTNTSTSNSPLTAVDWDFGFSNPASGDMVAETFPKGMYTTVMTVSTSNGCMDQASLDLNIIGPSGSISADKDRICPGDEVTFTISGLEDVTSWTWDFDDGNTAPGAGNTTITYTYDNINLSDSLLRPNVILLDETSNCDDTSRIEILVEFVEAVIDGETMACENNEIIFNNVSTVTNFGPGNTAAQWNFGDGTTSTENTFTHSYADAETYTVSLVATSPLGCMDTTMIDVEVEPVPEISLTGTTLCTPGEIATITVQTDGGDYTYTWSPLSIIDTFLNDSLTIQTVPINQPGNISVLASSTSGACFADASAVVDFAEELIYPEDFSTLVCAGTPVVLPLTNPGNPGAYIYEWSYSPADFAPNPELCSNCNDPIIIAPEFTPSEGDTSLFKPFLVTLTAALADGSCLKNTSYLINVIVDDIPNAFTPDNDGVNDFFNVPFGEEIDVTKFQIFNRWGQMVYDNDTPLTGWDGNFDGKPAASDVFLFIIETSGNECTFSGDLTLIR